MLGPVLVSVHNIRFYQRLMADIRKAIGAGRFDEFARTDLRSSIGPGVGEVQQQSHSENTEMDSQERDTA
jgi:queuine tRNA-ribosyltransferase